VKVVILAGGLGTRLAEETEIKPKPMVEIGGKPILLHIMKHYSHYGFKEFYIALGYKGEVIRHYFLDYLRLNGNLSLNLSSGDIQKYETQRKDWIIHLIDTGLQTKTGGRLKRLEQWLSGETFMLTYGDGVSDLDLSKLLSFHRAQNKIATVTAVRPPARFGGLVFDGNLVAKFTEKPQVGEGWINGGFMVFEPNVFKYISGDEVSLESEALEQLAADRQLAAYRHERFWQCMDTLRDLRFLDNLWQQGHPPWKLWD
jgi:glucose-1-phosphate cytidylyltransferase